MNTNEFPQRLLIINIDGLRHDVFHRALSIGRLPNLGRLVGGVDAEHGLHLSAVSTAPSITFCGQVSIITGLQPDRHGIPGNQFFDRFGDRSDGKARFYAFDVGDTLAVDDAVLVFTGKTGLLGRVLDSSARTLYEIAADHGMRSLVVYHMLGRGAAKWIKPNLVDIARFTKGGGLVGISAERYDRKMVDKALEALNRDGPADILTLYFMGLDHHSHQYGPGSQMAYLADVVDEQVGVILAGLEQHDALEGALAVIVADHGQIEVVPDDRHSLRLSFPFDREMGYLFDALRLDVHDYPGEDPNCDAVVASNGGLAHVYLRHRYGHWRDRPRFAEDVLTVARAFWEADQSGKYAADLQGALDMILVRDVQREGWEADYYVYTPERLMPVIEFLNDHPEIKTVDAPGRLKHLAGPYSGDLLLLSNYAGGYYFGPPLKGMHGGLHPEDSCPVLSLGWVGASAGQVQTLRDTVDAVLQDEGRTGLQDFVPLASLLPVLCAVFGWENRQE